MSYKEHLEAIVAWLISEQKIYGDDLVVRYPLDHKAFLIYNYKAICARSGKTDADPVYLHLVTFIETMVETDRQLNELIKEVKEL